MFPYFFRVCFENICIKMKSLGTIHKSPHSSATLSIEKKQVFVWSVDNLWTPKISTWFIKGLLLGKK